MCLSHSFMNFPLFYKDNIAAGDENVSLDENTSKHIVQVLRMQRGASLQLTDGKGNIFTTVITDNHRKKCMVKIIEATLAYRLSYDVSIAISLIKNSNRFEWFIEKAVELGVSNIIPLICTRTEKQQFRLERMQSIAISAMLQSRQTWLPEISVPVTFTAVIQQHRYKQKFIAHCEGNEKRNLQEVIQKETPSIILIGPEGDFTREEIEEASQNGFVAVSLGNTRLRTETAGIVAASLLSLT